MYDEHDDRRVKLMGLWESVCMSLAMTPLGSWPLRPIYPSTVLAFALACGGTQTQWRTWPAGKPKPAGEPVGCRVEVQKCNLMAEKAEQWWVCEPKPGKARITASVLTEDGRASDEQWKENASALGMLWPELDEYIVTPEELNQYIVAPEDRIPTPPNSTCVCVGSVGSCKSEYTP